MVISRLTRQFFQAMRRHFYIMADCYLRCLHDSVHYIQWIGALVCMLVYRHNPVFHLHPHTWTHIHTQVIHIDLIIRSKKKKKSSFLSLEKAIRVTMVQRWGRQSTSWSLFSLFLLAVTRHCEALCSSPVGTSWKGSKIQFFRQVESPWLAYSLYLFASGVFFSSYRWAYFKPLVSSAAISEACVCVCVCVSLHRQK